MIHRKKEGTGGPLEVYKLQPRIERETFLEGVYRPLVKLVKPADAKIVKC